MPPAPEYSLAIISNSGSRGNRKLLPKIEALVSGHRGILHRCTDNVAAIRGVLAEFADHAVDVLAINGGDGTAAAVLGCLLSNSPFSTTPKVVLLPGGTANMSAGDVGMRGRLLATVTRLIAWVQDGSPSAGIELLPRAVMRVQPGHAQPASFGMFLGAGIIMQGTEYAHREIHSRGLGDQLSLGLGLARTVWGWLRHDPQFYQPVRLGYSLDGVQSAADQETVLLLVSTLQRLFLGIRPYWGQEPGALRLSMIRDHAECILLALPAVLRGRPNRFVNSDAGYFSHNAQQIALYMDGSYNLDGEIFHARRAAGPVKISNAGEITFLRVCR